MEYDEEKIEAYLLGTMEAEEQAAFKAAIEKDPALKAEVAFHRVALSGIEDAGIAEEKALLDNWENEAPSEENAIAIELVKEHPRDKEADRHDLDRQSRAFSIHWVYKIAATLLIVAIPTYLLFFVGAPAEGIYESYYEPFPNYLEPTTRGEGSEVNDLVQGLQFYEKSQYEYALEALKNYMNDVPDDPDAVLYLGLSYQALGDHEQALTHLKQALELGTKYHNAAQWYVILSYLQIQEVGRAKQLAKKLSGKNSTYAKKAKNLLRDLK